MKSCANCANYSHLDSQCRKELKTAFVNILGVGMKIVADFPPVKPEWWCDEYRIKFIPEN